jgi:hypothetical protein
LLTSSGTWPRFTGAALAIEAAEAKRPAAANVLNVLIMLLSLVAGNKERASLGFARPERTTAWERRSLTN